MDVEKTMQFILEVQASTDIRLEKLAERTAALEAAQAVQAHHLNQFAELTATWAQRVEGRMDRLDANVSETTESVKALTENMNALIKVVDGLVRRDDGRAN
jgi:hypothetical protein